MLPGGVVARRVEVGVVPDRDGQLHGHTRHRDHGALPWKGLFQAASGGTLFLDEVGNLPLHLQAKLLSALEQRQVTPVGSDRSQEVDLRIVAATNVAPDLLRNGDRFRQDLLFRLNTVEITLPPLRDRRDDILPIARHYLDIYARRYAKPITSFSAAAEKALAEYDWPGNVRALRHAVERAVILSANDVLQPSDLQLDDTMPAAAATPIPTVLNLDQMARDTIHKALIKHGFNISHAARELGLTRASLYRRMEKHGL